MAFEHLVLAGLAGIVVGLGSAGLMLVRLLRASRRAEIQSSGLVATIAALVASMLLAAAGFAVVGALAFRRERDTTDAEWTPRPTAAPVPDIAARGGRALAVDPNRLGDVRELTWSLLRMRVRVPAAWETRAVEGQNFDVRHPTAPSTYLLARAVPLPAGPSPQEYLASHVEHARSELEAGRIAGFSTMRLGAIPGVMTLERRGDGSSWLVTWTGFQPAAVGSIAVTLLLGAASDDFERDEPLLGAILGDARFE